MNIEPPKVPDAFMQSLKKFDNNLGVEWCGDHYCIVDTSKIIARYKRDRGGLIVKDDFITVYDRLFHLSVGRILDSSVLEEMRLRDTYRFGDKRNAERKLNEVAGKAELDKAAEQADFDDAMVSEIKTFKRFGVTVPGRKDNPNTIKD